MQTLFGAGTCAHLWHGGCLLSLFWEPLDTPGPTPSIRAPHFHLSSVGDPRQIECKMNSLSLRDSWEPSVLEEAHGIPRALPSGRCPHLTNLTTDLSSHGSFRNRSHRSFQTELGTCLLSLSVTFPTGHPPRCAPQQLPRGLCTGPASLTGPWNGCRPVLPLAGGSGPSPRGSLECAAAGPGSQ